MELTYILIIVGIVLVLGGVAFVVMRSRRKAGIEELNEDEKSIIQAKTFDQFEIQGIRKRSIVSTMYRAVDPGTHQAVALRILNPEPSADPEQVKSFLRRGEILEFLNKQHGEISVIKMLKYGQARVGRYSRPFIAVEYFEGKDIGELLAGRKVLSATDATAIITQVAKTLAVALRERVWHHQMAMQSVMVRYSESGYPDVRLVDFDLFKQDQMGNLSLGAGGSRYLFMSPEQFENKIVDQRSDIYSMGVLYYLLLSGRPPFEADDYAEIARKHTVAPPPPLPDTVPQSVRDTIAKMLGKQPGDRFRTMEEAAQAIGGLKQDSSWKTLPDLSTIPPLVLGRTSRPTTGRRPPTGERRPEGPSGPSRAGAGMGKVGGKIGLELKMWYNSLIGSTITKSLQMFTLGRFIKIGVAMFVLAIIAGVGYLMTRSNDVKGTISIAVRDQQGKGIAGAGVGLEMVGGDDKHPATFTDPVTDQKSKQKFSSKTGQSGTVDLKYSSPPDTRVILSIAAPGFVPDPRLDTIVIRADSALTLAYRLSVKPKVTEFKKVITVTIVSFDDGGNAVRGGEIFLDGNSTGKYTPAQLPIQEGPHQIEVRHIGYVPADSIKLITITEGQTAPIRIVLKQSGKQKPARVAATPKKELASRTKTKPPVATKPAAKRTVTVTIVAMDDAGNPVRGAEIYVDGKSTGKYTPSQVQVLEGQHRIVVVHSGYQLRDSGKSITISANQKTPIRFTLRKKD